MFPRQMPPYGQQMPGQQMSRQQMPGQQMPRQQMPEPQMLGQQMPGQQQPFPFQGMGMPPMQPPKQRQGFLSKLFGQKKQAQAPYSPFVNQPRNQQDMTLYAPQLLNQNQQQRSARPGQVMNPYNNSTARMSSTIAAPSTTTAAQGGIGSFFSNLIADPSSMIGNVEKVVKVAQTVGPVVQQYSPMIKNFPNVTKLLSSLQKKEQPSNTSHAVEAVVVSEPQLKTETKSLEIKETKGKESVHEPHNPENKPKLYV